MVRYGCLIICLGMLVVCLRPASGQMASPPLSNGDRALVRQCMAMYGRWDVPAGQEQAEQSRHKAAKRFFDAMPRDEIARRLVPIRKALYRGTRAYTSVAFVLTYYGSDADRNGLRVVEALSLAFKPPAKLKAAGFKGQGEEDAGQEEVADAVETLYRRHHSAAMLLAYFRAPSGDGEAWPATVGELFLIYPTSVLRIVSTPGDITRLAEAVAWTGDWSRDRKHGDYSKAWRTICTLERNRDPRTARFARRLHRAFLAEWHSLIGPYPH